MIHKQLKECEQFTTIVAMVSVNQGSYICFMTLMKTKHLTGEQRNVGNVQISLFENQIGGLFEKPNISP